MKIDFLRVQKGDPMLQPHLAAVTVFVHSGLPAQPSGFRVRFEKTTSDSAVKSCRHDSATAWKQQIKLSQVFQRSPGTNRLSRTLLSATQLQDLSELLQICCNFNMLLQPATHFIILSASACCHPPLAIIQKHTNPRSFHGFLFVLTPHQAFVLLNLG